MGQLLLGNSNLLMRDILGAGIIHEVEWMDGNEDQMGAEPPQKSNLCKKDNQTLSPKMRRDFINFY